MGWNNMTILAFVRVLVGCVQIWTRPKPRTRGVREAFVRESSKPAVAERSVTAGERLRELQLQGHRALGVGDELALAAHPGEFTGAGVGHHRESCSGSAVTELTDVLEHQ
jgi:hypothetical protein